MDKHIDEIEFTIYDTETTGLEPEAGDRIIEIAAIRFKGDSRISAFQTLINPKRSISQAAFEVNRISQDMLINAPTIEEVIPGFLAFIQDSCLCSYNAGFDLGFLNNELRIMGKPALADKTVIDVLRMAKGLFPACRATRFGLWHKPWVLKKGKSTVR